MMLVRDNLGAPSIRFFTLRSHSSQSLSYAVMAKDHTLPVNMNSLSYVLIGRPALFCSTADRAVLYRYPNDVFNILMVIRKRVIYAKVTG